MYGLALTVPVSYLFAGKLLDDIDGVKICFPFADLDPLGYVGAYHIRHSGLGFSPDLQETVVVTLELRGLGGELSDRGNAVVEGDGFGVGFDLFLAFDHVEDGASGGEEGFM